MLPHRIEAKLAELRRLLRRLIFMGGLSRVVLVAVALAAVCLVMDWAFHLPPGWRLAMGLASLAGLAAALVRFLIRPMLVPMPDDQLALLFERRFPDLSDVMVTAVQLAAGTGGGSRDLIEAVIQQAEAASEHVDPGRVPQRAPVSRLAVGAVAAVTVAVAFSLAAPEPTRIFLRRFLDPFGPARWPRRTDLVIEVAGSKGPVVSVPKGDKVSVRVTARNARASALWKPPKTVWLDFRYRSRSWESQPMRRVEDHAYLAYFNDVSEDLELRARADGAETAPVRIRVVELPRVEDLRLTFHYPKYTGIPPDRAGSSVQEIRALVGTRVTVRIRSNRPLRADDGARILIDPTGTVPMRPADDARTTYEGTFPLALGMKWFRVELVDPKGLRSKHPRTFPLRVLDDKPPRVRIVRPAPNLRCTPYAVVPLRAEFKDDLAVRSAWLAYALGPKDKPKELALTVPAGPRNQFAVDYRWDLAQLRVKEGDTIAYRAAADDYRDVFPPGSTRTRQVGRSRKHFIRIVSTADLASELDQALFALRDRLKKVRSRQEAALRSVRELFRKAAEGRPMTNDDRSAAADAENVQRELARTVRRVADAVARVRERMKNNRIGSFKDRAQLEDTRRELRDVAGRDMPRAADFVKDARRDLAGRDGRTALGTASRMQRRIVTRLDKIIAAMTHNEDIDNLVRAARQLLRKQRTIKTKTTLFYKRGTFGKQPDELDPTDRSALRLLVRNQRSARDDMRNLEQDMLNVFERLKTNDPQRAELVRQAQVGASRDQIRLLMEEAALKLAANRIGLAATHQQTAIRGLERLLQLLEQARQESGGDSLFAQALADVKSALRDVRRLLKHQQGHLDDTETINRNAAQARRLKTLKRRLARLRKEHGRTADAAARTSRLRPLADQERRHGRTADDLGKKLREETADAAGRRAPQAGDLARAAQAVAAARSQMASAAKEMQAARSGPAGRAAAEARRKLDEAERHLDRALAAIESQRLQDTRETALKQGETQKDAAKVARRLGQLAKENEAASKKAARGLAQSGDKVTQAHGAMQRAQADLDRNDTASGEQHARDARDRLADAQRLLRKLRDDLENKRKEQKLLDLIAQLQPMLDKQLEINAETRRIDDETVKARLSEPSRPDKVLLGQLASDESKLANHAARLLQKVEGENAPVFAWGLRKLQKDMNESKERLVAFQTDSYTQDIQKDIADTLRMLIDALKREQQEMQQQRGGGSGGGGKAGGKPVLIPPSAQLKLLKARELEIHNKTKRIQLRRELRPGRPPSVLQKKRVRRLADEQAELGELTRKLAEALEREVRERRMQEAESPIPRPEP